MKNRLCYLVDIVENNENCVVLEVKDNKEMDLIKLGCFDGDERLIRLTKGRDHTCTIFYNDDRKPFSWHWGTSGFTLVSDKVSEIGRMVENCITEDFDIYIGEDVSKVRESLYIKSLDDVKRSKHKIEVMYFKNNDYVIVHKDNEFYKEFPDVNTAINHFQDLNFNVNYINQYTVGTGCIVERYDIEKNKELLDWKEEPYYITITDIKELNDIDSFTVARVINGVNCVELHYSEGKATVEYGTRVKDDAWENEIEEVDWFNKNMSKEELENKLWDLFDERYDTSLNNEDGMEI